MNLIVLRITQWLRTRSCSLERAKIANRNKSHNQKKKTTKTNKQTNYTKFSGWQTRTPGYTRGVISCLREVSTDHIRREPIV